MSARFAAFVIDWLIRIAILYAVAFVTDVLRRHRHRLLADPVLPARLVLPGGLRARARSAPRPANAPWASRSSWTTDCRSRRPPPSRAICCASPTSCPLCTEPPSSACCCAPTASGSATSPPPRWWCTSRRPAPKATLDMVTPVAPVRTLSTRDQSAVIALAARAPTLTIERLDELAALAASVQGESARSAGRRDAPRARRRAMVVRTARMTPLHFENLYQEEWDELASAARASSSTAQAQVGERLAADSRRARGRAVPARLRAPGAGPGAQLSALSARPARQAHRGRAPGHLPAARVRR